MKMRMPEYKSIYSLIKQIFSMFSIGPSVSLFIFETTTKKNTHKQILAKITGKTNSRHGVHTVLQIIP